MTFIAFFEIPTSECMFCSIENSKHQDCLTVFIWHGNFSPLKTEDDAVYR